MTLRERYPNTKPRVMIPAELKAEGKVIEVTGRMYATAYGDLREIWTLDARGVHEMHLMREKHLEDCPKLNNT